MFKERIGYYGILLFGLVSLFADVVYEGARSVIPDFLKVLGASATVVGFVIGLGEFVGYVVRLPSGFLADASGKYWRFIFFGYCLTLFSVPALALVGRWELAALLIFVERFGKAFRTPSRDAALSIVTRDVGAGKAFGLHELMDQVGAVAGPLIVSMALVFSLGSMHFSFSVLILPALASLAFLYLAYVKLRGYVGGEPRPRKARISVKNLDRRFWIYNVAAVLSVTGFLHYSLIAYRMAGLTPSWVIPVVFAAAMGVDAVAAVALGFAYDRFGLKVFWFILAVSALPAILAIKADVLLLSVAILLFGVGMGAQESVYRSAVADLSPLEMRGTAYGFFNTFYGLAWLIGGFTMGFMYDLSAAVGPLFVAAFSIVCQLSAAILLALLLVSLRRSGGAEAMKSGASPSA